MDEPRSGVLKSNVDTLEGPRERPRRRVGVVVPLLVLAILAVLGAAAFVFLTESPQPRRAAALPTAAAAPTAVAAPTVSLASAGPTVTLAPAAPASQPVNAPLPDLNGISCDALESTIFHIHAHLAIFVNGQAREVPYGVGVGKPWHTVDTPVGPFVDDGSCFYWLHTHTENGVIHIESPIRRTFTLRDFFAIWQQPLSATQIGSVRGAVTAYLNGTRTALDPGDIPLTAHALIQLDLGEDVPPQPFDFAPGD